MLIKPFELARISIFLLLMCPNTLKSEIIQVLSVGDEDYISTNKGYLGIRVQNKLEIPILIDNSDKDKEEPLKKKKSFLASDDVIVTTDGEKDYYKGPNGYYGVGQQVGDFYFFCDNR